jgi:hypothetical protein
MAEPGAPEIDLRQVALPTGKIIRRRPKSRLFPGGIVAEVAASFRAPAASGLQTADLIFPPN